MKKIKDTQTPYFDCLERKVTPKPERPEPMVWFRELRFLTDLSRNTEIRRVEMHRGLNILWAEPEDPDVEQGLYRDGLAGHATGKTLFCRLLRHLLGEEPFGTKAQRDGIAAKFPSLWVVASVRLNQESWVVGRPLAAAGADFAVKEESVDAVLSGEPPLGGFKEFTNAVEAALGSIAKKLHPDEGWRHLLPWLTRDQEARFANLAAWRESASEGDNPQTKVSDRHLLMRAVLDLLDLKEPDLRVSIEADLAKIETGKATTTRLQTELKTKTESRDTKARALAGKDAPPELDALQQRVASMVEVLKEALAEREKQPESPAVAKARKAYDDANDLAKDTERQISTLQTQIQDKTKQQTESLLIVRNLRTGNVEDPTREAKGWCTRTIQVARERCCVAKGSGSDESATNIAELDKKAQAMTAEIETLKSTQSEMKRQLPKLISDRDCKKLEWENVSRVANRDLVDLARKIENADGVLGLFLDVANAQRALDTHSKSMEKFEKDVERKRKEAGDLRANMDLNRMHFANVFADIIRAVMGKSVAAKVSIDANGIATHVERNGELSGAALDTIKTLAFDLAAVVLSIEGRGSHPRFLVHDGPREGDMARIIYERFFIYTSELEKAFLTPDDASFQYIITTTTHPPASMREKSRWLLSPVLSSKNKEGRLLKENF